MNNNQYIYNQPQMSPGMLPQVPMQNRSISHTWKERLLNGGSIRPLTKLAERSVPNWIVGKSIVFFFVAFVACILVYGYPMDVRDVLITSISVVLFFYGGHTLSKSWAFKKERNFIQRVFLAGLLVRLLWVLYCYFVFNPNYWGNTIGDPADTEWYMEFAQDLSQWLVGDSKYPLSRIMKINGSAIDDAGYPMWLAVGYVIWGEWSDALFPMVIKCIIGAYCAVSIYNVAKRHFGEGAARMAALFVALNPNMIYWCGTMFKEIEMVFLCCLSVDEIDKTLTSQKQLSFRSLLPGLLAASALFFFRAALAAVMFLAVGAHIVMASSRVMSIGKKVLAGVLVATALLVGIGDNLRTQTESMMERAQSDSQKTNMEWRSRREGGNEFAKYAGAAVFAPLIFTIPFPTFNVALESHILQRQLSGGSYIKNVFSFFVIWVMIVMLITGEWRKHVFIIAYTGGYLASLVLSEFAQSGRFHMPVIPMLMLFAAYGIQIAKSNSKLKRWYTLVLVLEVFVCLAWNWFKLAGRGMV